MFWKMKGMARARKIIYEEPKHLVLVHWHQRTTLEILESSDPELEQWRCVFWSCLSCCIDWIIKYDRCNQGALLPNLYRDGTGWTCAKRKISLMHRKTIFSRIHCCTVYHWLNVEAFSFIILQRFINGNKSNIYSLLCEITELWGKIAP